MTWLLRRLREPLLLIWVFSLVLVPVNVFVRNGTLAWAANFFFIYAVHFMCLVAQVINQSFNKRKSG